MTDEAPGNGPLSDDARIDSLQKRIDAMQNKEKARTGENTDGADEDYRLGNRVLADLIAGIGGGALIGWVLDLFLGTGPWLLLIVMFLGIIVAFRNIFRLAKRQAERDN